jgi:hypothetical protein
MKIPSRSRAAPVRATSTVWKRQAVWPVHHIQNHACRVTFLQPVRRAVVLDQSSSLRPHCIQYILQHRNKRDCKIEWKGWACTLQPHQPWLIFPSWWNVRQKAALATLRELFGQIYYTKHRHELYYVTPGSMAWYSSIPMPSPWEQIHKYSHHHNKLPSFCTGIWYGILWPFFLVVIMVFYAYVEYLSNVGFPIYISPNRHICIIKHNICTLDNIFMATLLEHSLHQTVSLLKQSMTYIFHIYG